MNKIDQIVDQFAEKLKLNGNAIESYGDIDWVEIITNKLPTKYSPSFMSLISRYIFDDIEVGKLWLFANRGDQNWDELSHAIFRDSMIFNFTSSNGFLHFARPVDGSYDPVCFDIRNRKKREYPVVRLDHESILISNKIEVIEILYPSLLELMNEYISR
jgi:hypothetical protein